MLAGWGRAILLQLAHPLVAQGVADHSGFAADRRGRVRRLQRTLRAMLALTFGTAEEVAEAAALRVGPLDQAVRLDQAQGEGRVCRHVLQRLGGCAGVITPQSHDMGEGVAIMTGAKRLEGSS